MVSLRCMQAREIDAYEAKVRELHAVLEEIRVMGATAFLEGTPPGLHDCMRRCTAHDCSYVERSRIVQSCC